MTLGRYVKGTKNLPIGVDREVVLPLDQLGQHVVMLGTKPAAKNRAASLFFEGVAREVPDAQVLCFDGDADLEMTALYEAAMVKTGRQPFVFPQQPFNVWTREDCCLMSSRLVELLPKYSADDADRAARILQLACRLGEPPLSHEELLKRLNYKTLCEAHGAEQMRDIRRSHVEAIHIYCEMFFSYLGMALDGERSFGDLDTAYFSFDLLSMGWSAAPTIRMLLSQLLHYIQHEKDPGRLCLVLLRVPAALIGEVKQAALLERARKHGVVLVLIYDTLARAGDPTQVARTLYGVGTLVGHSNVLWPELEAAVSPGRPMELIDSGSAWGGHQRGSKVTREDLLDLSAGRMFVIRDGAATLVDASPPASS